MCGNRSRMTGSLAAKGLRWTRTMREAVDTGHVPFWSPPVTTGTGPGRGDGVADDQARCCGRRGQTVIVLPSKVVNVAPLKSSARVALKSTRVAIATFSPRRNDSA